MAYSLRILTVMFNNRDLHNSDEHAREIAQQRGRDIERRGIGVWMDDPPVDFAKLAAS